MFLTLKEIKKHLNIDEDFNEDNDYLNYLYEVCIEAIQKHIDRTLEEVCEKEEIIITNEDGEEETSYNLVLPTPLKHGLLLLIGDLYANRESQAFTNVVELPLSYQYLLRLYTKYSF